MPNGKDWKAKVTAVSKLDATGIGTVKYDIYNPKGEVVAGSLVIQGKNKVVLEDSIRMVLKKYISQNQELEGIKVGDEITLGGG